MKSSLSQRRVSGPSELKIMDSHTMIPIQLLTLDAKEIKQNQKNYLSEIDEINMMPNLGKTEARSLLKIQNSAMASFSDLVKLTRRFYKLLGSEDLDGDVKLYEAPTVDEVIESEPEDEDNSSTIQVSGTGEGVEVEMKKLYDKYGMTAKQREILSNDRRKMKGKYFQLQEELVQLQETLKLARKEHEELCKRTGDVNRAPIYECKVTMSSTFPNKEKRGDGCLAAGEFAGTIRQSPSGKLCKKDYSVVNCCKGLAASSRCCAKEQ